MLVLPRKSLLIPSQPNPGAISSPGSDSSNLNLLHLISSHRLHKAPARPISTKMLRPISIAVACLSNIGLAAPTTGPSQASTNITADAITAHSNTTAPHASIIPRQWGYGYDSPFCYPNPEPTKLLNPTNVEKLGRYFLFGYPKTRK
ncbi:MAG: hypothetical protein Q9221_007579 [Calogaya cf. arnoldii]